jgi:hypothetical protein
MSRFEEENEDKDENLFPDIDGDDVDEINMEYIKVLEKRELIEALKLQAVQKELNYSILRKSIAYCEKTWFWRFKTFQTKLNLIVSVYQTFKAMIDIDFVTLAEDESKEED